jgi:hypothetical protein
MYSFAADGDGHQSQRFMSAHFAFLFSIKWQICHLIRSQRRQPRHIAAPCVSMSSVASHAFTGSVPSWYASSARHREYQRGTGRGKTGNEAGPVFNMSQPSWKSRACCRCEFHCSIALALCFLPCSAAPWCVRSWPVASCVAARSDAWARLAGRGGGAKASGSQGR